MTTPAQTAAGKKHPFSGRSLQSTTQLRRCCRIMPGGSFTLHSAHGCRRNAAMRARNNDARHALDGDYWPAMDIIDSAVPAGHRGRRLPRESTRYRSPVEVAAAAEFADTEKMTVNDRRCTGLQIGSATISLLFCCRAFPSGGMWRTRAFATPTVIAGDKSLQSAGRARAQNSWSGNLVTNATWKYYVVSTRLTTYTITASSILLQAVRWLTRNSSPHRRCAAG